MEKLEIYKVFSEISNLTCKKVIKEAFEKICTLILQYTKSDSVSLFIFDIESNSLKPYIVTSEIDELKLFNKQLNVSKEDLINTLNDKSTWYKLYRNGNEFSQKYEIEVLIDINYNHTYKMVIDNKFLGIINVCYSKESKNNITEEMHEFIKFISNMIGVIINNFRLRKKIELENDKRSEVENELDKYFDISSDLVSICELDGTISRFSDSWMKLTGWNFEELNNLKMKDIIHEDDAENVYKINRYLLNEDKIKNKKAQTTLRHRCKDGTYKTIVWNIQYVEKCNVFIAVGKDITDIIISKEQRKRLEDLVRLEAEKNEFLTNMSHELKTPLNMILGTMQVMEKNMYLDSLSDEAMKRYIKNIRQNSYRLLRLVNNVLDLNKIEINQYAMEVSNENIINIIEDVTISVAEYMSSKNIDLIFDTEEEEIITACNKDAIERIMLNLLSNAIKFVPESNGKIDVNIYKKNRKIIVSVKDNGMGIPKDKQDIIFERFKQVNTSVNKIYGGSGVGLSLVKSLLELHGGNIQVVSKYGEGSNFIFELPIIIKQNNNDKEYKAKTTNHIIEKFNIEFSDIYS